MTSRETIPTELELNRFKAFVTRLHSMTAGGPPVGELLDAIANDTVNMNAVYHLIAGFPFASYTQDPPEPS